ncbi:MAG: helix-turn-helix domain-containing protein [Acidobacteriota bacterium]
MKTKPKPSAANQRTGSGDEPALYPRPPGGGRAISRAAWYLDEAGVRTVSVGQRVLTSYALSDKTGRDYAMAQLSRCQQATQQEVATAFGVSRCTVNRLCRRLDAAGIGGLVRKPRSDKTPGAVTAKACRLRREGKRIREVSARTGVSTRTVRAILSAEGLSA